MDGCGAYLQGQLGQLVWLIFDMVLVPRTKSRRLIPNNNVPVLVPPQHECRTPHSSFLLRIELQTRGLTDPLTLTALTPAPPPLFVPTP